MKKIIILSIAIILSVLANAQKPEKIYSIAKVSKPHEYYIQQAELWWKTIEKNNKNEDAWYNYFKANRYARMTYQGLNALDGKKNDGWIAESKYLMESDEIIRKTDEFIPNTFTNNYIKTYGRSAEQENFKYLEKAYEMDPDRPEMLDAFATYYETHNNPFKRKEFNKKLYTTNEISSGFLAYGYNVLMTIKSNGIVLTFGDNDTYPMWMLQDALDIRPDVVVLNIPLASDSAYRAIIFKKLGIPEFSKNYMDGATSESEKEIMEFIFKNKPSDRPLYIGLPAWKEMKEYENNLYLVGLALEYSKENIDNIALLKNNFENKYALDYIKNRFEYDISADIVNRTNINYLPGIFKLYEHYMLSGDITQAQKMKELGLLIAQKGGKEWLDKASQILK